jgi:hypothetical protein
MENRIFITVPPPEGGWVGKTNCNAVALASLRIVRLGSNLRPYHAQDTSVINLLMKI